MAVASLVLKEVLRLFKVSGSSAEKKLDMDPLVDGRRDSGRSAHCPHFAVTSENTWLHCEKLLGEWSSCSRGLGRNASSNQEFRATAVGFTLVVQGLAGVSDPNRIHRKTRNDARERCS